MQDKSKIGQTAEPSFADTGAVLSKGRIDIRDLMRRKMIRKMAARRSPSATTPSPWLLRHTP